MRFAALALAPLLLAAQAPHRQSIAPAPASGWSRIVVDDDGADGLWISDAQGRSVPFLRESEVRWSELPLAVLHPLWGRDGQGRPTGAFTLRAPEGFRAGDREQARLAFDLSGAGPWVCRVELARRGDGGAFVTLDDAPRYLYDLGPDRRADALTVPWDGNDWRVTLVPVQGAAPKLLGLSASACTLPSDLAPDGSLPLAFVPAVKGDGFDGHPHADLGALRRLASVDLVLAPPAAPVPVGLEAVEPVPGSAPQVRILGSAELWNLPALDTRRTRIAVDGEARLLRLDLPAGVVLQSATASYRHRRLFFPAEAGQAYVLHSGGVPQAAPGSLQALPASSRAFYAGASLALGAPETDPGAQTRAQALAADPGARLRRWLPWGVGALVLLLGAWGASLLRKPQ